MSVERSREGPTSIVRLDRPDAMHSFDLATIRALRDAIQDAMQTEATGTVLVTSTGEDAFCTGADLTAFQQAIEDDRAHEVVHEVSSTMNEAILALVEGPKPVVAALDGVAAGGGLGLALACDVRVASRRARLTPAFLAAGVSPDGGATWFLPRMIGSARARDLLLNDRMLDAETARAWGLLSEVVDADKLAKRARAMADSLGQGPSQATAWAKRHLARAEELADHLARETEDTAASAETEDFREGVQAFLEGREPRFDGPGTGD